MAGFLDAYITEAALARQLDVSVSTLRAWPRRGYGPPRYNFSRKIYYKLAEVQAFLDEQMG